jgi:hypothetical protein
MPVPEKSTPTTVSQGWVGVVVGIVIGLVLAGIGVLFSLLGDNCTARIAILWVMMLMLALTTPLFSRLILSCIDDAHERQTLSPYDTVAQAQHQLMPIIE